MYAVTSGVAQGGHLSPLLFSLFVNSLPLWLTQVKFLLYADGIKIYYTFLLQSELNIFTEWVSNLGLSLNITKCHVTSFSRARSPILFNYFLHDSKLERVYSIKDLGFNYSTDLSFSTRVNIVVNKALKTLQLIIHNTKLFISPRCLCTFYFALVRSLLEYRSIVWKPFLAKDQIRLEHVQNKFLNYVAFQFSIHHIPHDYTNMRQVLNIQTLSSRRDNADLEFISALLNGSLDVPDLLSSIPFRTPSHSSRTQSRFYISAHKTSYGHNHILHRIFRAARSV
ncbi:Reverse transcriptase domain [Cinara cedri]|uniref:Reverse transcriptase domain n=1 Tax=Cinara cedri TaxID=506608 RepID=A0A5E4NP76_9HEMI|nr:Reverse transcriptase domain [Cinara cedri]